MGRLLSFSSGKLCRIVAHAQTVEPNQHVRQSWVRQFALGKSVMAVSRQHHVRMRTVENEIREALWAARGNSSEAA